LKKFRKLYPTESNEFYDIE